MKNIVGDVVFIIAVAFMFIAGPIYKPYEVSDVYVNNYINNIGNDFQKQVRDNGYIDASTYNDFINKLNRTKRIYKVKLIYSKKLIYPDVSSSYKAYYLGYGNAQIFNTIYKNKQKYYMHYGDDFKVEVTETEVENSTKLKDSLFMLSTSTDSLVTYSFGGMVENES